MYGSAPPVDVVSALASVPGWEVLDDGSAALRAAGKAAASAAAENQPTTL